METALQQCEDLLEANEKYFVSAFAKLLVGALLFDEEKEILRKNLGELKKLDNQFVKPILESVLHQKRTSKSKTSNSENKEQTKKKRTLWTPEEHQKFLEALNLVGPDANLLSVALNKPLQIVVNHLQAHMLKENRKKFADEQPNRKAAGALMTLRNL